MDVPQRPVAVFPGPEVGQRARGVGLVPLAAVDAGVQQPEVEVAAPPLAG